MPTYLLEHFVRSAEPYDAASSPHGYIPFCVAENSLVWDLIEPKVTAARAIEPRVLGYDDMVGPLHFREALATFMSKWVLGRPVRAEQLAVLAGAGSILETLFYTLADAGEGVLVPTPSYAGFWMDLEGRDGLSIVEVPGRSDAQFRIGPAELDAAVATAEVPVRALLFTSPNNPLGTVYGPEELEAILAWAEARQIHVVFDEVYALSVFGEQAFTSAATLREELGDYVHIVWAFSKDFAASGLRCGVLVSDNAGVHAGVSSLSYWSCCSGDTLALLKDWITDEAWLDTYVQGMRSRLGEAHRTVTAHLAAHDVACVPSEAAFFVLVDLRAHLDEPTWQAEEDLWRWLLDEANLNLTPGVALRSEHPGLFRLCFASVPPATLQVGMNRLTAALTSYASR
ncbi:MAG: aminotransferase class I/II-fold pyridoxal phosphate-dependent enzyme [Proteobacteria bacterium]|nr:aminotransferase class I/II-fold pyridoxal phosphate-dependent enzyme [Pseudomonadota bacterium]